MTSISQQVVNKSRQKPYFIANGNRWQTIASQAYSQDVVAHLHSSDGIFSIDKASMHMSTYFCVLFNLAHVRVFIFNAKNLQWHAGPSSSDCLVLRHDRPKCSFEHMPSLDFMNSSFWTKRIISSDCIVFSCCIRSSGNTRVLNEACTAVITSSNNWRNP